MADEPSLHERLLELALYAPVGIAVAIAEELPKLTEKGRDRVSSQVQVARMIGKLAAGQAGKRFGSLFESGSPTTAASPARSAPNADATRAAAATNGRAQAPPPAPAADPSSSGTAETTTPLASDMLASDTLASDLAATEILGIIEGEPAGSEGAASASGAAAPKAPATTAGASRTTGRNRAATSAPTSRTRPKTDASAKRRPAAPAVPDVTALPIPGYDTLAASQVVQRLGSLRPDELDLVRRYEVATRGRRTILHRIGQLSSSDGRATG